MINNSININKYQQSDQQLYQYQQSEPPVT